MSSPPRLLLLSGTGGAGTTTVCAATVEALRDEGLRGTLVDATSTAQTHQDAATWLTATLGRLGSDAGADPLHPSIWTSLATVQQLSALLHIGDVLHSAELDAVVVDCGDLGRTRELLQLPGTLLRVIDSALTPRVAMRRTPAPADGPAAAATTLFEDLQSVREQIASLAARLLASSTVLRLVTMPEDAPVSRTLQALPLFALLGLNVEGVVVNRCARKADDWPREVIADQEVQVRRLEAGACGAAVWKSTSRVRAVPKGRSALGPLGRVRVLDEGTAALSAHEEEYVLDLPLVGAAAVQAEVGRLGDDLVVAYDGAHRWLPLPPVLRRCRATHATRTPEGLRVSFVPDMSLWRQDPAGSAA